jgi:hypothetical protein
MNRDQIKEYLVCQFGGAVVALLLRGGGIDKSIFSSTQIFLTSGK